MRILSETSISLYYSRVYSPAAVNNDCTATGFAVNSKDSENQYSGQKNWYSVQRIVGNGYSEETAAYRMAQTRIRAEAAESPPSRRPK